MVKLIKPLALDKLKEASNGVKAIVWTSDMTDLARKYLSPDDYIIQIWSYGKDLCAKLKHLLKLKQPCVACNRRDNNLPKTYYK